MKKELFTKIIFLILALFSSVITQAQEKENRFSYDVTVGIGRAKYEQTDRVTINATAVSIGALIDYNLSEKLSLGTGAYYMVVDGNGVLSGNEYAIEQEYLRIPLKITWAGILNKEDLKMNNKATHIYGSLGIYAGTLLKEKVEFIGRNEKFKNGGWNMGLIGELGAKFAIAENSYFGVGITAWNDFFEMKKDNIKRKLDVVSTIGINFKHRF